MFLHYSVVHADELTKLIFSYKSVKGKLNLQAPAHATSQIDN